MGEKSKVWENQILDKRLGEVMIWDGEEKTRDMGEIKDDPGNEEGECLWGAGIYWKLVKVGFKLEPYITKSTVPARNHPFRTGIGRSRSDFSPIYPVFVDSSQISAISAKFRPERYSFSQISSVSVKFRPERSYFTEIRWNALYRKQNFFWVQRDSNPSLSSTNHKQYHYTIASFVTKRHAYRYIFCI